MRKHKCRRAVVVIILAITGILAAGHRASALSLALDSIATWGKFPRFCVNTYRWGDKFFNSYDSAYVEGTGYKFNVKFKTDSWWDDYVFEMPEHYRMRMASDGSTSAGFWLTYLALSVGYDMNVSKYLGGSETTRKKFQFRFNCALLSADLYWISNDAGTHITSFGHKGESYNPDIKFTGINTFIFGVDAYYHFNNKRYSRAAAFNYSKIQKKSQGSFYLGFSYWKQNFTFNFNKLPDDMLQHLPEEWAKFGYIYKSVANNYSVRVGYGYNWVPARHWLIAISESPILGLKNGTLNGDRRRVSVSLYNRAQASIIWNNRRWFGGLIGSFENGLFFAKKHALITGVYSLEASLGFRFNIW